MKSLKTSSLNGLLIVDKPYGWTSHDVCQFIRKKFSLPKVGHAGILDRTATGVLVILIGLYTKFSSRFSNESKEYEGTMELGVQTSTHDAAGDVIARKAWEHLPESQIRQIFEQFRGERAQLPPMASAVKLGGVRLYKLARQGKEVDRPLKAIHVYELDVRRIHLPYIDFYSKVSKGTYVRTLANDIGISLGTYAYLKELRRMASGVFRIEESVSIPELKSLNTPESLKTYVRALPVQPQTAPLPAPGERLLQRDFLRP